MILDQVKVTSKERWWEEAQCVGVDVDTFFPEPGTQERYIRAIKFMCHGCPVTSECLEYALETDSLGIWAGTDEKERSKIKSFSAQTK